MTSIDKTEFLNSIVKIDFPKSQYYQKIYEKSQIVLHHTVSGGSAQAVANYWESLPSHVATSIVIDKEGVIHQLFSSKHYAYHIGNVEKELKDLKLPARSHMNQSSVAVELVNWGALTSKNGKLYNDYGNEYNGDFIHYENAFRNYNYYDAYTKRQIESLRKLLIYWNSVYDIPISYREEDMWSVSKNALIGEPGLYTHVSYRYGKSDLHPQKSLIKMFKTLQIK